METAIDWSSRPAGVVAQVQNIALELIGWYVGLEILDRFLDAFTRLFVELGDADVADIVALPGARGRI